MRRPHGCWRSAPVPATTLPCSPTGSETGRSPPSTSTRRSPKPPAATSPPCGYRPAVVTGDGARGCASRGPYDRIIATCTLPLIPEAWLAQCAPDARVLAPFSTGLISLRVRETADGRRAEGHFLHTPAFFVRLRGTPPRPGGSARRTTGDDLFSFLLALAGGSLDAEEAMNLWEGEGRPDRERFGLTVERGRQWAWLDDPQGPYTWPLTGHEER